MNPTFCSVALCMTLAGATTLLAQQAYFTRVTEGPPATNTEPSLGLSLVDYDNDGLTDIFVANLGGANSLYHNEANLQFTKATAEPTFGIYGNFTTGVYADYDNDGDLDLFVANFDPYPSCFFRNDLGAGNPTIFTRITNGTWVNTVAKSGGVAWGDYDNDGFVDLAVANSGNQDEFLYRNDRAGGMVRVIAPPLTSSGGRSQNCSWADYDGDGDLDVFVANSFDQTNFLFRSEGGGAFTRVVQEPMFTTVGSWTGSAWADYDNDADLDLYVSNANFPDNDGLYQNNGDGTFTPVEGDPVATSGGVSEGAAWGDFDNDGYLDLFVANYHEPSFLFHNERNGTFSRIHDGEVVTAIGSSGGCAWADLDNDGSLDLYVGNQGPEDGSGEPNFLYRNNARANGNSNGWLLVRLVGTVSNRSAIGAKIRAKTMLWGKGVWQMREVSGGSGSWGQNDLRAHFGLGDATNVTTLRIEWPSGIVQELTNLAANQILTITEPARLVPLGPREFQIRCWKGMKFGVEKSPDLQTWASLGVVTNVTGTLIFQDTQGDPQTTAWFYRVVSR